MIIDMLPSTKSRMKILRTIYSNKDINIREIIRKTGSSPNLVVKYVKELEKYNLVNKIGDHTKYLSFNFDSRYSKFLSIIIEHYKRDVFCSKNKFLVPFAKQIEELDCIFLVYGSYARGDADKESDLDLWAFHDNPAKIKKKIQEILVTLPLEYSLTIEKNNKIDKTKPIYQNILKHHIVLSGEEKFLSMLKRLN